MKTLVAVTQMTSGTDKKANLKNCSQIIRQAAKMGAKFIALPENFAFFGDVEHGILEAAEPLDGPSISFFKDLAKNLDIWLSLGGFPEKIPNINKIYNSHLIINNSGEQVALYRKINLFSVNLPDGTCYSESDSVVPGQKIICFASPFFSVGLSICYDLRFSQIFNNLRAAGAEIMLIPAAFTKTTGQAHWEVLLRARAIESQSYVMASAQIGTHSAQRKTHGHAMIVDPWGQVVANCGDNDNIAIAEIDLDYLRKIRLNMPMLRNN